MSRAELLALAERVEALSGADREVDAAVALAVGYKTWPDGYGEGNEWEDPSGKRLSRVRGFGAQPPAFTASLDAAMGLVPSPGFIAALSEIAADGLPGCCICTSTDPLTEHWGLGLQRGERAEVLARCVTAAALRARAEGMA